MSYLLKKLADLVENDVNEEEDENEPIIRKRKARDWRNLGDTKVQDAYKKQFPKGIEDSTGLIDNNGKISRLNETPESIKEKFNTWLDDYDSLVQPVVVDDKLFEDIMRKKEDNPDEVLKNNNMKEVENNLALSPFKIVASIFKERFDCLLNLQEAAQREIDILTELCDFDSASRKFLEKFFGPAEDKRRAEHYRTLMNVYQTEILPSIQERGKVACQELIKAFEEINEYGSNLPNFDTASMASIKGIGKKFITNLQQKMKTSGFLQDVVFYLYNTILAGDGQAAVASISSRLKKIANKNNFSLLINEIKKYMLR